MGQTLATDAGFDRSWKLLLRNGGVDTPYPIDAVIDAAAWAGDDLPALFEPAGSWMDVVDGVSNTIRLAVTAGQSSSVDPGTYRMRVGVTSGGIRSLAFDGHLAIEGGPGTGVARKVYASHDELLLWHDQIGFLQNLDTSQAGTREERAEARDILIRHWLDAYRPRGGFIRVRGSAWSPIYGFDRPDGSRTPPTRDQLEAWLLGDRLVIDEGVRKAASLIAIAIILERQETRGQNPYRAEAAALRERAMEMVHCSRIRLDTTTSPDGVADLEIAAGSIVTYLEAS